MDCKSSQKAFLNQTILVFGFSKLGVWPTTSGWFSLCSLSCSVVVSHRLSDSLKDKFNDLCCQLERERVISKPILAGGLETETVPSTVCNTALLRKKQNQDVEGECVGKLSLWLPSESNQNRSRALQVAVSHLTVASRYCTIPFKMKLQLLKGQTQIGDL